MEYEFYPDGTLVLSISGETDSDEGGQERNTGPRAWGWIADYSPDCGYSLYFPNGTTVYADHEALENRAAYRVITPDAMAQRLCELQSMDAEVNKLEIVPDGHHYETAMELLGVTSV